MNEKLYILDTNVLLHDPRALFAFADAHVCIPGVMIEELDSFKREGTDRGRSARLVIRLLDELRARGSLSKGVPLDNGSTLRVVFLDVDTKYKIPFALDINDNQALLTAYTLQKQGFDVRFVTKDLNARIKADALGIAAVDYVTDHTSEESFYHGWVRIPVPAVQLTKDNPEQLQTAIEQYALVPNQFVLLESQHNPHNYQIFRYLGHHKFAPVFDPEFQWPFKARNPQQLMALNLMLDPAIELITLFGPAGTGKTFLALLAGLHQVVVDDIYQKMLVARPIVPLGKDVGYLPGTLEEKLHTWMLPVFDNMEFIFQSAAMGRHMQALEHESRDGYHEAHRGTHNRRERRQRFYQQSKGHHGNQHYHKGGSQYHHESSTGITALDDLIEKGKISLEAITYMRGRSIPYQYIIIDEVQNLTPHEVKTLVSRVGQGSKIVLAGDPYQIDTPYLDFSSNGLVVTSEKFKGQDLFGSVYLETTERSRLSQLATELL
ncbi:PhoH family protein [Candidatus Dependentiae bacterium]|nr:PhoH family protein [Candidatus Dependentiae bacterium]MCC7414632.1 PhoH family protein [Campylobacterota bacterium]